MGVCFETAFFVLVSDIILTEVNREIILKTYYVTI